MSETADHPASTALSRDREDFVVITGMSGAGRSTAANVLEDLGWYVVDNLPSAPRRYRQTRSRGAPGS